MKRRILCIFLAVVLLVSMFPTSVFAAHDSSGKPLDLTGDVYLALYVGGSEFPGEPAEHAVSGYLNLNASFGSTGFGKFAESAQNILEPSILNDVVQGTSGVWGVFSTTGGSRYLLPSSGIVDGTAGDVNKPHDAETEKKIIQTAINNGHFRLGTGESIDDYTIIWYVIKYQRSDSAWHIDGIITKKTTYSVNYYGNGNTSGAAPTGSSGIQPGSTYTVAGNTGSLRKIVGKDVYIFNGWNTAEDGTGTHYDPGQTFEVNENITLYAQWYLQNRYTVSVVAKLDDVETNIPDIFGQEMTVWIKGENADDEYLQLQKTTAGTYTTTVTENDTYQVYFKDAAGTYHEVHDHKVVIFNQNGRTELLNYSVIYDANADSDAVTWTEGAAPVQENYHATTAVTATTNTPVREGYTFLYWMDQDNNIVYPNHQITSGITEKTVLTAQWEECIDVTVRITVNHGADAGVNLTPESDEVLFNLLQQVGGVDVPVESIGTDLLLGKDNTEWNYQYDFNTGITTMEYTFRNLPQGIYTAAATKSRYSTEVTRSGERHEDQLVDIQLKFAPETFDLNFQVQVNFTEETRELLPKAVNVRVLYWNGTEWEIITQQGEGTPPVTVYIDENGFGDDYFPVWKYYEGDNKSNYRVAVTSFVMPDGTITPASGNYVTYTPVDSGLYRATVKVEGGITPSFPNSNTNLTGAEYDANAVNEQVGIPVVTVDILPKTVTFVAEGGTIEGVQTLALTNQFKYPDLNKYVSVPIEEGAFFVGWYTADGKPAANQDGQYLTEDVTYYAKFSHGITVNGTVTVASTYKQDGETVTIIERDTAKEVLVVLEKIVGDNIVDIDAQVIPITYTEDGIGTYRFENIPNDGTQYRVKILAKNYHTDYDNESDADISYSPEEYAAILGDDEIATVHAYLKHSPESYVQLMEVDASRIGEGFRPSGALAEILYRDLGDIHHYNVISQHTVAPYGKEIALSTQGLGGSSESLWQYHTDGTLYEYQMNVTKLYGNVTGVFAPDGTVYNSDAAPFIIEYDPASRYSAAGGGQACTLKATLVPKEYKISFDMGLGVGEYVVGMENYLTDSESGEAYAYHHTWSERAEFDAYPYRPGYVFDGWECDNSGVNITKGGHVVIAAALAEDVVLRAVWKRVVDPAYVIRHLELNTDDPLRGAMVVENATIGSVIYASEEAEAIKGYKYAGAMVNGQMYTPEENAQMTVGESVQDNVMVIYYLPDGSDGYTEQVESNLKLDKQAFLEDNGTYTIHMETFTTDNPVTTLIQQNTPLDIVLVLDQSGSLAENEKKGLIALQSAVDTFVEAIADHGRHNEVDHRIALVGYASNKNDGTTSTNASNNPYSGGVTTSQYVNTGVFDSNGKFHLYDVVKGFNYTLYNGTVKKDGVYYTYSEEHQAYLLLTHHDEYRHLLTEDEARMAALEGEQIYGYVYNENNIGSWVKLTRNPSGLWLYNDKQLYSLSEFFTYHTDVWTHRHGLERREIHAYGTESNYREADGHEGVYTRTEATGNSYQLGVYQDALIPVSVGYNGSGGVNPGLIKSTDGLGANGATRASLGMEMANSIFAANPTKDRVRVVLMFTDGQPGQSGFLESEANATIAKAYETKNTYGAYVYTIGLYDGLNLSTQDRENIDLYMNAVSSNYRKAQSMDDLETKATYVKATDGERLADGKTRYVRYNNNYYPLKYGQIWINFGNSTCWYFSTNSGWYNNNTRVSSEANPVIQNGKVGNYEIYEYIPAGMTTPDGEGYYHVSENTAKLKEYFTMVMKDITTKITKEIVLHEDTILRDIMGQGLVLRPGSVVTAYKVAGAYNAETEEIKWETTRTQVAQVTIPTDNQKETLHSPEIASVTIEQADGSTVEKEVPYISVYNLTAKNATDPDALDYHPHTIDITGYDFENWYISDTHPNGYKMVVEVTNIEATDDVQWGRSTTTNNSKSGLWLPADAEGNRELLLPFDQPTTIFVERAYVLDYGKEFVLADWYFDDEDGKDATPIHLDFDITNGMNGFDVKTPNLKNAKDSAYGNPQYGNVRLENGKVIYSPTTMNWGGYDSFYVFGNTWRKTVLAQDANQNGNLWNKVTVIPANNIYYEDSFITTESTTQNSIEGFTFTGAWSVAGEDSGNTEIPEHLESAPYGDVHGWTDSLGDDVTFTDGSAHFVSTPGASAQFTFTGTGVEVYTRTNNASGMVVAVLNSKTVGEDGKEVITLYKSLAMDNLAVSGDYYHIPTVAFKDLPYGTYTLQLVATVATGETGLRSEYYIDGVRIHNPLGNTTNYYNSTVKDAYGLENNAVFTEVRDILIDKNNGFNADQPNIGGAVFIDQIKKGQGSGNDQVGEGVPTYEIGTFEAYGPKNEVYLSAGQAIVLKVEEGNTYYMGLKSLTGKAVTANVSGVDQTTEPTAITITHSTDMYYRINPVDGYIVIQNGNTDGAILSVTNLRTTNMREPVANGGIIPVAPQAAVMMMRSFSAQLLEQENDEPTEETPKTPVQIHAEETLALTSTLFLSVRQWLDEK